MRSNSFGDGTLYTINALSGAASKLNALSADPADKTSPFVGLGGTLFSIDFDPVQDKLHIVSDVNENLLVNPANGQVTTLPDVGAAASDIVAIAHSENIKGAVTTRLWGISFFDDQLYQFSNPNSGTTNAASSPLGVDSDASIGFDIRGADFYATLTSGGVSSLYKLNSTDGTAALIGAVGASVKLTDIALELDTTPPTVISISKLDSDPNSTKSVRYLVTFSESVTGVDASDFGLTTTGSITGATVSGVAAGDNTASITVTFTAGTGSITLNLVDDDSIVDSGGNPLGGVGTGNGNFAGPSYTIVNGTGPTVTINQKTGQNDPTSVQPVNFTVVFSQAVVGFADGDIQISGTANATTAKVTTTDSITFNVEVSGATQGGTVIISFPAGAAQDTAGVDSQSPTIIDNEITLTANQAPVITQPSDVTITQNANAVFTGANLISVADPDVGTDTMQIKIAVTNGLFTLSGTTGITFNSGTNGSANFTFTGKIADVNAALNNSKFSPTANFIGDASITIDADDLGHTGAGGSKTDSGTTTVHVQAATNVNQPPDVTSPGGVAATKNTTFTFTGSSSISIADPDAGSGPLQVTLSVNNGTLSLSTTVGLTFQTGDGTGDSSMKFTGTTSAINTALTNLKFDPTNNFTGPAVVTINADDQGNTGTGGAKSDSATVNVEVNAPANTAPVAGNDSFSTTRGQTLTIGAPGVLGNDTDADKNALTAIIVTPPDAKAGTVTLKTDGSFVFTPVAGFTGSTTFSYKANDGTADSNTAIVTINVVNRATTPLIATGAGPGGGPHVMVYNNDGSVRFSFYAFDQAFTGGVAVATGDVDGDGIDDIITGAGAGADPHVIVYSGANLSIITSFYAFDVGFAGGVSVAAGDFTGDGKAEIIVGAGAGGSPLVKIFNGSGAAIFGILAFDAAFTGGVNVGSSDLDNDGKAEVICGAGPGGGPHVTVYQGGTGTLTRSFYAFDPNFTGGVNVGGGLFNNKGSILTGVASGELPIAQIWDFATTKEVAAFFAFDHPVPASTGGDEDNPPPANTGVHISSEIASDGTSLILLGESRNFEPLTRVLEANTLNERRRFLAYDPAFLGGVFVG